MVVAAVGGLAPAVAAAVVGFLVVNWLFTPPINTLTIAQAENLLALVVFLAVAAVVSLLVTAAARRSAEASRAAAEAETLAAAGRHGGRGGPPAGADRPAPRAFGLDGAALLRRDGSAGADSWSVEAASGSDPPVTPEAADRRARWATAWSWRCGGAAWPPRTCGCSTRSPPSWRPPSTGAGSRAEAARAQSLAEADELRTALLQAVSHDLRTPLASIKASASSLLPARHRLVRPRTATSSSRTDRGRDRPPEPRWSATCST